MIGSCFFVLLTRFTCIFLEIIEIKDIISLKLLLMDRIALYSIYPNHQKTLNKQYFHVKSPLNPSNPSLCYNSY